MEVPTCCSIVWHTAGTLAQKLKVFSACPGEQEQEHSPDHTPGAPGLTWGHVALATAQVTQIQRDGDQSPFPLLSGEQTPSP